MWDQIKRVENAGLENAGPSNGVENARPAIMECQGYKKSKKEVYVA